MRSRRFSKKAARALPRLPSAPGKPPSHTSFRTSSGVSFGRRSGGRKEGTKGRVSAARPKRSQSEMGWLVIVDLAVGRREGML